MVYSAINNYWIQQGALNFTLNALDDPDKVSVAVAAGAVIMAYANVNNQAIIDYNAAHNYRAWALSASPTHFERTDKVYVYVRLSKVGDTAMLVYPYEKIPIDPALDSSSSSSSSDGVIADTRYYYIMLGALTPSLVDGSRVNRTWTAEEPLSFGTLDTDEQRNEQSGGDIDKMFRIDSNNVIWTQHNLDFVAGARLLRLRMSVLGDSSGTNVVDVTSITKAANIVGSAQDFSGSEASIPTTAAMVRYASLLTAMYESKFLRKDQSDSTPYSLGVGGDLTVGSNNGGDLTVRNNATIGKDLKAGTDASDNPLLEVDDTNKKVNVGADLRSRNFRQGVMDGQGWQIDKYGNAELESAVIRSSLTVQTLIVNRQQAQEGDTIFSDNDQFENVEEVVPNEEYIITVKEKWEGYYTAQLTGNIIKGIINTFAAKDAGVSDFTGDEYLPYQGKDNGGNIFYTSWMLVVERWGDPNSSLETNQFRVVMYGDDYDDPTTGERVHITPAGKNFPPCKLMVGARWGSILDPDTAETEAEKQARKRRQTLFLISVTDGRITKYSGVNKPILEDWMCGMSAGETPTFVKNWESISPQLRDGYDYLYAQGIIVSDFIKVDSLKRPIVTYRDCGEWIDGSVPGTTVDEHWNVINTPAVGYGIYLVNEYNPDTLQYETHDVWHNGKKWRCLIHQPVSSGGELVYHEPVYGSSYWQLIGGGLFALGFYTDGPDPTPIIGLSVRPAHVDETVVPYLLIDQEDISSNVTRWIWERESNYPALDEAWYNSARVDPTDPTSPLKRDTRTLHITTDDLPSGWDAGDGHVAFKCSAIFGSGSNQSQIINRISIV